MSRTTTETPERRREWPTFVDRVDAILTDAVRWEGGGCCGGFGSGSGIDWLPMNVRSSEDTRMKGIYEPRRVQHQVNKGFGFEVSLDAVVLFDDRD